MIEQRAGLDGCSPPSRWWLTWVFVAWFGLGEGAVFAEKPLLFERISVEDGLSQSTVFSIAQDHQGFLWLGTEDGLNRFDAYGFRVFRNDPEDPQSVSSNWVVGLADDPSAPGLWVMGQNGIDFFDPFTETFQRFGRPRAAGREAFPTALHRGESGQLWVGTDLGLFSLAEGELRPRLVAGEGEDGWIFRALLELDGVVWCAAWGAGLLRFDPHTGRVEDFSEAQWSSPRMRSLEADREGQYLWVGTDAGLDRLDLRVRKVRTFVSGPEITQILDSGDGRLLVGSTSDGLRSLDKVSGATAQYRHVPSDPRSLSHDTVWSVFQDRDRGIWVGTGVGGGLNRVFDARFQALTHSPDDPKSLPNPGVWAVHQDAAGVYWIGNETSLVFARDLEGEVTGPRAEETDLSELTVRVFADGPDGRLWIGTQRSGLHLLEPATRRVVRRYGTPDGEQSAGTSLEVPFFPVLPSNSIRSLATDRAGALWVGTHGGGLARLHPDLEALTAYPVDPEMRGLGTSHPNVWAVLESMDGGIWIGTEGGGLNHLLQDQKTFQYFGFSEENPLSLSSDRVWSLHEDSEGRLWIGTKDGGLNRYEGEGRFRRYTEQGSDLPNNTVYGILSDGLGRLWLSTNNGLACFDPETERFFSYDSVDGLPSNEMNFGAFHKDSAGRLLFGGIRGLAVVPGPESFPDLGEVSPTITELRVADRRFLPTPAPGSSVRLDSRHRHSSVKIHLSALSFATPSKVRYRYRLEGLETEWNMVKGHDRLAYYSSVPPGRYVFRARASNGDGVWGGEEISFHLRVRAPFWQSPVFWGILACVAAGAVVFQVRARSSRRRRVRLLLAQNRERDRIRLANDLHDGPLQELHQASKTLGTLLESREGLTGATEILQLCREGLDNASEELRHACYELLPPTLKAFGLEKAIRSWLSKMQRNSPGTIITAEISSDVARFSEERASQLFRLFQGFVYNALRHSGAGHIRCVFEVQDGLGRIEIADDGRGFVVPDRLENLIVEGHLGLAGAAERVSTLGGSLHIRSRPGAGTRVLVTVPVDSSRETDP